MNIKAKMSILLFAMIGLVISIIPARADPYGADAITDLFSSLWNSFWPLIALFFIIAILLTVFTAPLWLKRVFGMVK